MFWGIPDVVEMYVFQDYVRIGEKIDRLNLVLLLAIHAIELQMTWNFVGIFIFMRMTYFMVGLKNIGPNVREQNTAFFEKFDMRKNIKRAPFGMKLVWRT